MMKLFKYTFLILLYLSIICISNAQDIIVPRLSPMPVGIDKEMINLNGTWGFSTSPDQQFFKSNTKDSYDAIEVPGEWEMQGYRVDKGTAAGYIRQFEIPQTWNNKRIKLRCNAIYSESVVYINGKEVGKHIGGFTAFEYDITDYIKLGNTNQIAISVLCESEADALANGSKYAAHPIGGILRDIFIFSLPEVNLSMFHATTDFDSNYENATLTTEVEIANESLKEKQNLTLKFKLKDTNGNDVVISNNEKKLVAIKQGGILLDSTKLDIVKPNHWTAETPYLYSLTTELWDGSTMVYNTSKNIGFREIEVRGNQVFVNNQPIKLRGVNRHEIMPLRGRSPIGDIWEQDVKLFREANVNYIRTSHYPPDEKLLDACDKFGMYLEVEAPFCWAHQANLDETQDNYLLLVNQHIEMVNRDRSHPSVLMWSLGNESLKYEEYFRKAGEVIKIIDPSRPRIFSEWGPDADKGELEVTNHHYPGPSGPSKYKDSKRPVTFDEYCHLNSYNRFELSADPGVRNSFGALLDRMWTDMYNTQSILGGALWSGIDDTFFLPDGSAYGYGTWGPIDGWRRPKPEYWNVKKAYSPVRIKLKSNVSDDGVVSFDVENRHDFTDLSDCTFKWTNGNKADNVSVSLPARGKGSFDIQIPKFNHKNNHIQLVIQSPLGFVIDEYSFKISPGAVTELSKPKQNLVVQDKEKSIEVTVGKSTVVFNKLNGLIDVLNANKQPIIKNSPSLMVLPLNSEGRGIQMLGNDMNFEPYNPTCDKWVAELFEYHSDSEKITINVKGEYDEAQGSFTYIINNSGSVSVEYDFEILTNINPRQVGLVFDLDKSFDNLSWERKGYWNAYPKNHLGSLSGTAKAFDSNIPISGSSGPDKQPSLDWSYDQTTSGSNLFRGTKENIIEASLSSGNLGEITINSNGKQHFRSWLDVPNSSTKMLVADYNNAGGEGYLSSHAAVDYRPLKKGDIVSGKIVLFVK